ncbi:amino acid kinase [Fulvimarina endophytica]|uniref:Amino acid kinase n=1 Tax=Fulvimarina endophytica TaxID=2293836 RepID=A0A371X893_9HYPH|nr:amino acid kinase [Fulvimarina endophytica]RFC65421.1 amino acid kinase [Fulvimarina endophytica]
MKPIILVKLGGSTVKSPNLQRWIAAIEQTTEPCVVVPGGGPFADTVRRHQAQLGYDDATAHEMSVLAMEQFGCVLLNMSKRFVAADSLEAIDMALSTGRIPVWMARNMVMNAVEIAQDWTTTSDSLAAWLQGKLKADRLCLVKLIDVPHDSTVDALSRAGIVDPAFPEMVSPEGKLFVAGPSDLATAGRRFALGDVPGRIVPTSPDASSRGSVIAAE